ncbi:MAG: DUF3575 domain-containing protein [Bacteroidales bacterium]|nr:DUF3575 domain-containing protein [Bacteroidales bacterium]
MKVRLFIVVIAIGFFMSLSVNASGQDLAIKTNFIYDATSTVNLGTEVGLSPKWTLDVSGNLNLWSKDNHTKWKHWLVQPEARYWFCDRFSRDFLGAHLIAGAFNFGNIIPDNRYQGYAYGCGVAYGFAFMLSKHFNLELEAGIGYMYFDYEHFQCDGCGRKVADGIYHYFGPTKAAINLVFLF